MTEPVLGVKRLEVSTPKESAEGAELRARSGERGGQAARPSRRTARARISCLVGRPDRTSSISACNASRCNALRLSWCDGRRGSLSHGLALRSDSSPSSLSQAHASTRECIHKFRLKQPSLL